MDDYRTSFLVFPLNLILPIVPTLGQLSPHSTGTQDIASSAEDTICNQPERPNSLLVFPTATLFTRPYNHCTNLQRVCQNYSNKDRPTPAKCSTMESPAMDGSLVAPTALCSALIHLTTELFSQAHLTSFLTITNNNIFQHLCPTQWPTVFLVSSRTPSFKWRHNHGNNPQTLPTPRTSSVDCAAASLAELGMSSGTPRPRHRAFSCLPTPFGPRWNRKSWTI